MSASSSSCAGVANAHVVEELAPGEGFQLGERGRVPSPTGSGHAASDPEGPKGRCTSLEAGDAAAQPGNPRFKVRGCTGATAVVGCAAVCCCETLKGLWQVGMTALGEASDQQPPGRRAEAGEDTGRRGKDPPKQIKQGCAAPHRGVARSLQEAHAR